MKNISKHVSYKEATRSLVAKRNGWDNKPTDEQLARVVVLAEKVFEPLREALGTPIYIHSMFRSPQVNKAIGGAKYSQHMCDNGAAMDIDSEIFGGTTNIEIGDYIRENLEFDQLIYESENEEGKDYGWIHCSYNEGNNRKQVLVMYLESGRIKYKNFVDHDFS